MRFNDYLTEGVYDPSIFKAIFMCGGSGSGKTYVASKVTGGHGLKIINSDKEFNTVLDKLNKTYLKKMDTLSKEQEAEKNLLRVGSKKLTSKFKEGYIEGRLGLVIDGTARHFSNILKDKTLLNSLGYDTYMIFVNTSLDVAQRRNKERPRVLPEDMVIHNWNQVQQNIGKFQNLFGRSNFIVIDNNDAGDDIFKKAWKKVLKLVKKPVTNHIAKGWIEAELEKKRSA